MNPPAPTTISDAESSLRRGREQRGRGLLATNGRRLLLALFVLCSTSGCRSSTNGNGNGGDGGNGGTGMNGQPLKIINWNVHNLVNDELDDPKAEFEKTDADYLEHRKAVAKVLASLDADVVLLQEVEHVKILEELNTQELNGRYLHLSVIDANDPRGIDNGVMSKFPFEKLVSHQDDFFAKVGTSSPKYKFARDCVEVHLQVNDRAIALLNVHFKSKENDNADKRLAEAQHSRKLADDIRDNNPNTAIAILGDFNDLPGSLAYGAVIGNGENSYKNVAESAPEEDRWSFIYKGTKELVDQHMINPVLAPMLQVDSIEIVHSDDVDAASDHAPIVATYQIK